ncbi:MAG: site-specific DNA-methyltransferase [Myxococcota bacterium]|nr:site-specific DNA-methyltransferase [Myxococcota bacterium]
MAELVWKGKSVRGARGKAKPPARSVSTDELYGDVPADAWRNRLVLGDNAHVLPSLLGELAGKVSLVYIDPPFDTGGDFHFQAAIPGARDGAPRVKLRAYRDDRGLDEWLQRFHGTARLIHALLAGGGSLYVHLDAHVSHYAKVVLDEVFGAAAFQREIIWRIGWVSGFKSRANNWIRNHDVILFYAKGGARRASFHKEYLPYPPEYVRRDGAAPRGPGYPLDDVWNGSELDRLDSIQIMSFSREKVGFPTQKNEKLVARIVRASSSPGDIVLDCFVGSGTAAVVAEALGRRWIACDLSPIAIHATRKRLLRVPDVKPFAVQRLGPLQRPSGSKMSSRVDVDGPVATIEIESFAMAARSAPAKTRATVTHWSQWIEGWCVDWDYRADVLRVGSRAWRSRGHGGLALTATHAYDRPGRYVALVKVFDVLGGTLTKELRVDVRSSDRSTGTSRPSS